GGGVLDGRADELTGSGGARRQPRDLALAGAPEHTAVLGDALDEHLDLRADEGAIALERDLPLQREQVIEPPFLLDERDVVLTPRRGRARAHAVRLQVDDIEA